MDAYAARLAAEAAEPPPRPPHPLFRDPVLLQAILREFPYSSLPTVALVAPLWAQLAQRELLNDVRLEGDKRAQAFRKRLEQDSGRTTPAVRCIRLARPASLLPLLPTLVPNLTSLELALSTESGDLGDLVATVRRLPRLERLVFVGQEERNRRGRTTPLEAAASELLRELTGLRSADEDVKLQVCPLVRLRFFTLRNTPFQPPFLEAFLEAFGAQLDGLVVEGCGVDASALLYSAAEHCPNLRVLRIAGLPVKPSARPTRRRTSSVHPLPLPSPVLAFSGRLTSLHLTSLSRLDPAAFSLFALPSHSSLRTVHLRHCDLTAAHLSFFTSVTTLRLVDCPSVTSIPVFVDTTARPDLGAGCRELRQLSILGPGAGLSLGNLWELAMLGREEGGEKERRRGLQRLTLDGAAAREPVLSIGFFFTFASPNRPPRPVAGDPLPSSLPSSLAPPAHLIPYLSTPVLSAKLPSLALLQALVAASDLEELSLFGVAPETTSSLLPATSANATVTARLASSFRQLFSASFALLPLFAFLFAPFFRRPHFHRRSIPSPRPPAPSAALDPDREGQLLNLQAGVKSAFARDGLPSPPPPCYTLSSVSATGSNTGPAHDMRRRFLDEDDEGEVGPPKRLSEEEVEWLLDAARARGGRLTRVYV